MQHEKDFPYHCKNFVHNHDFVILLEKIVYDTSVFETLDNNLCLCIVNVNIFFSLFI